MKQIATVTSVEEMLALGGRLADESRPGDVLALAGTLGAGKTHLVKGFAAAVGFAGDVTSPTFSLVQEYRGGRLPIYHIDFYRLESVEEALAAGMEEYLPAADGISLVEWAERFPEVLPENTRRIAIRIVNDFEREVEIENARH
ncbi:MAG TPA: tRNA (adenosine(37)-N6)-threonylcarbamoyltransferase complex ATPase subunit type 1 TsaE [Chthoniobacterales bacterium]